MKKLIAVLVFCAVIFGIISVFFIHKDKNKTDITLYGDVEIHQVDLSFQVPGKIVKMYKKEGDEVKVGDILAEIDHADYNLNVTKAMADYHRAKAMLNEAISIFKRNVNLCQDQTTSKQDCDTIANKKKEAVAYYNLAKSNLSLAKNQASYTDLTSSTDGVVTTKISEVGTVVGAGVPVYTVSMNNTAWVRVYASEEDLGNLRYGMPARIITDTKDQYGHPLEFTGRI